MNTYLEKKAFSLRAINIQMCLFYIYITFCSIQKLPLTHHSYDEKQDGTTITFDQLSFFR
jgi:hypothetical protein